MINLQAVLLYSLLGKTVFDLWHLAEYNEEQKYMGGFAAGGRRMPADMKEIIGKCSQAADSGEKNKEIDGEGYSGRMPDHKTGFLLSF